VPASVYFVPLIYSQWIISVHDRVINNITSLLVCNKQAEIYDAVPVNIQSSHVSI